MMNKQQALKMVMKHNFTSILNEQESVEQSNFMITFYNKGVVDEYIGEFLMDTWQVLKDDPNVNVYVPTDIIAMFLRAVSMTWDEFDKFEIQTDNDTFTFTIDGFTRNGYNTARRNKRPKKQNKKKPKRHKK
jgi:hypothetical protein